ncbi:radial spoke head protein 3 homolog [Perognathus longimembris pacificus]|uniref:radial spoke head protein 3 homolog n=1 Tax=Perognathus longimembris pacificus TaxID=214514 RepID=UPI0020199A31|nr:radial spoke head protein 3 homolog [Perognathus longimembris pacificus]
MPAPHRECPVRRRTREPGARGRDQRPEVPFTAAADRKLREGGTSGAPPGCWATGEDAADRLRVPGSPPSGAPASGAAGLPHPAPPPLFAPRHPCPWHYLRLPGSLESLAPSCRQAKLHRKSGSSAPDMATAPAMAGRTPGELGGGTGTGTYTFTSRPRAVPCQRRRYREDPLQPHEEPVHYGNIMYDRRVIRGNTYALPTGPMPGQPDLLDLHKQQVARRKALARKRAQERLRPRTPEPVEGRKHVDVQTELYLEELADRIIEVDMECQTDAFLDRPPTPLFIPAKTGKDVATQILEGELFDFDLEVKPMLEVLVGKTIEQALLEVMEEEELANLRANQCTYEEMQNLELAEVQRLEEQERRHREEKERRKQQQWDIIHKHNETAQKISARVFAQRYLEDLLPSVFGSLRDSGYFHDPVERDIEVGFLPWLMYEVEKTMEYNMVGRTVLDMMIREVVKKRLDKYERRPQERRPGRPGAFRPPGPSSDRDLEQRAPYGRAPPPQERRFLGRDE